MKKFHFFIRKFNTYNIPSISNNTKVHKTYREANKKNEEDLHKIFNKELVAYPYDEDRYRKLLNIELNKEKRNLHDFFFNSDMYINVENDKIKNISSSNFNIENIDKYFIFEKEYLDKFFSEGLAGELHKDILMHNNDDDNFEIFLNELKKNNLCDKNKIKNFQKIKGIGLLYRKLTYEIINELKYCEDVYKLKEQRDSYNLDNYFLQKNNFSSYYDKEIIDENNYELNKEVQNNCSTTNAFINNINSCKNNNKIYSYKNRSILIDGKRGTGKSCILNSVILWAKLNNWLVIFIPDIKKYKFDINNIVRSNTNLYIQPELSRQFLEDIVKVNEKFLKEIKVNKEILHNTCLDGTHLLYNKRIYDDIIKKTVDTEIKTDENYNNLNEKEKNMFRQKLYKFYYDNVKIPNLLDKFSVPSNLLELAHIGINNSAYSNLCIYALFEHLKKQTIFPLLIAVDQFNYNLSVSEYLSINFENTKYNGYIPTYYFTIPKLLIQWDTSKYKRCFKIVATCWDRENRRNFRPELLGIQKKEVKTVRNFTLREFKNYVSHLYNQNIIYNFDINKLEYFYMLTGGNGFQARKLLTTLY
ncbi:mitochondrial ribosomal protein S29 precursor, putative [Plasmodium relictum]|uniref:Small ribosomal subunit protein mS29 n=1 Tax=Plasmodium relictum TaxID=85471 RepID=A0A1J1HAD5_PLARL|nr:mitochondrial ribosomal protein S29 precursor, putative [Plasmodium relictum]CRH01472.1 mitochondrial ribosomal protein S29 precursor, putative [Plasmodium relictum]